MKPTQSARILHGAAFGAAAVLAVLRIVTLNTAFDEDGLLPLGSPVLALTVLACALVFGGMCLLALRLNRLPGTESCFSSRPSWRVPKLAAMELLLLGGALTLLDGRASLSPAELILAVVEVLLVIPITWTTLKSTRRSYFFWIRLLPALYAAAALILRFRSWTHEPLVICLVPSMLAWTCCMVEMMLLTAFSLGAGHRRSAVLFGLAAGVFTCMTLPDALIAGRVSVPELLSLLGLALWCFTHALELLRYRVQTAEPKTEHETETPESEDERETEASEPENERKTEAEPEETV